MTPEAIADAREAHVQDKAHDAREAAYREALEARHEAHGGDEHPDRDDCAVCIDSLEERMLWGGGA